MCANSWTGNHETRQVRMYGCPSKCRRVAMDWKGYDHATGHRDPPMVLGIEDHHLETLYQAHYRHEEKYRSMGGRRQGLLHLQ